MRLISLVLAQDSRWLDDLILKLLLLHGLNLLTIQRMAQVLHHPLGVLHRILATVSLSHPFRPRLSHQSLPRCLLYLMVDASMSLHSVHQCLDLIFILAVSHFLS